MGVYIKGMKMLKDGATLKVVADENGTYIYDTGIGKWYFVQEVPKHGRLVDADRLVEFLEKYCGDASGAMAPVTKAAREYAAEQVKCWPTAIESEE